MRLRKLALVAAIACVSIAGNAMADQTNDIQLVSGLFGWGSNKCCDEPCDPCDNGCDSRGSLCSGWSWNGITGCCRLGEPYKLFNLPECYGIDVGGWLQLGYTSQSLPAFNTYDGTIQMQEAWLYAEKATDGSCGLDIGGRVDVIYGTDGPNTQAFGQPSGWDTGWDNGAQYGGAVPQLYVEAAYGDWSIIAGHFFTIIGYEVVPATGNFFYSHAYTMNFSEPFTHTGVLATYNYSDDTTLWGGWVSGWDSGFTDNGSAFLGGISHQLTCRLNLTYTAIGGRFADTGGRTDRGFMQSIVAIYDVSDSLQYILQSDYNDTEDAASALVQRTYGVNNYLLKTVNDCFAYGARFEWWNQEVPGVKNDLYALTTGVNYRPHANLIFRPELRFDWNPNGTFGLAGGSSQTTFGMDAILTY